MFVPDSARRALTTDGTLDGALELLKAGRLQEAAALLAAILKRDPGNERAWHMLSFALADREQRAYALRRVLRINPGNRAARSQLARISGPPSPPAAASLPVAAIPAPEAARAYGAGHGRIILHYLVPRILPLLIPQLVMGVCKGWGGR